MFSFSQNYKFRSLFIRITTPLLVIGFIFTIAIATTREVNLTTERMKNYEQQLRTVYISAFEEALWMASFNDIENISQVLLNFENIGGIKIKFKEKKPIIKIGQFKNHIIETTNLKPIGGGNLGDWQLIIAKSSTNSTQIFLQTMKRIIFPFMLFGFIIGAIVYVALKKLIVTPSNTLSQAMKAYQISGKIVKLPIQGSLEIIQIIKGYNHMAETLKQEALWQKKREDLFSSQAKAIDNFSQTLNNAALPLQSASLSFIKNIISIPYCTLVVVNINHASESLFLYDKDQKNIKINDQEIKKLKDLNFNLKNQDELILPYTSTRLTHKSLISSDEYLGDIYITIDTSIQSIKDSVELFLSSMVSTFSAFIEAKTRLQEKQRFSATNSALFLALESMNTGMCVIDNQCNILALNHSAENYINKTSTHIEKKSHILNPIKLNLKDTNNAEQERFNEWLNDLSIKIDFEILLNDQQWLSISKTVIPDNNQVLLWRNITEQKHQRENQAHDSKMKTIGRVTGGITHDFNNFLQAINGNLELALINISQNIDVKKQINNSVSICQSAAKMTEQLLHFSHKSESTIQSIELSDLIEKWKISLESQWPKKYALEIILETQKHIIANPDLILRSLINLSKNSIDAKSKGIVNIKVHISEKQGMSMNALCNMVSITFEDDAGGINEKLLDRITEPFFTTKPQGKGTGLGMALVQDAVMDAKGNLDISNTANGLRIELMLPSRTAPSVNNSLLRKPQLTQDFTHKKILIIEDSPEIANFLQSFLESKHAEVYLANSVRSFTQKAPQLKGQLDMIISDVNLPDGNAIEMLSGYSWSKLIPCLFISGDPITFTNPKANRPRTRYLCKPFQLQQLQQAIEDQLLNTEHEASLLTY